MHRPIVFLFSGQGSHYYQMGNEMFRQLPVFQQWMMRLDERVQALIGESVVRELYESQKRISDPFERTAITHPAIFMVEYALAQTLIASGVRPDCVLGTSMGEFAAAAVAGAITPEEALKLLIDQAQLLDARCERGGMLAVIHDPSLYHREALLYNNSELASVNFDSHFVLAGPRENLLAIEKHLKQQEIVCVMLPVLQAFHSSRIDPAGHYYRMILKGHPLAPPRIPFMSGALGKRLSQLPDTYLWDVVREPIQLPKAVQELERERPHVYLDLGPAGTMANFVKRNLAPGTQSEIFATMTLFNQDIKNVNLIIETFASAQSTSASMPISTPVPLPSSSPAAA
ncbi:MAG: acyltransferase domain-containing protein, partial [Tumebacillaceae bacterium]